MSCIFSCFKFRSSAESAKQTPEPTRPTVSQPDRIWSSKEEDVRAHKKECRENKKAFIQKYPNSRQAQASQQPPVRTAQEIREAFLKASEEFEKVEPPVVDTETEFRRMTAQEAAMSRAHAKAMKYTSRKAIDVASESTCFIPPNKFDAQQGLIKSKGQTKFEEAAARAAIKKEQSDLSKLPTETKPEKVCLDVRRIKSRPSRRGCLETKIGDTMVQSAVPLTPATIRTIALYPDAWNATKGAVEREGKPIKKITRKSSSFEKEARDPLPPKSKSATSHTLKPDGSVQM